MINIVVAMPCEAKPLVEHFALQRNSQLHAFPVYASTDMTLITSGVGKVNSAMAVAWLAGQQQTRDQQWLNIGMAGHASHKPGTLLVANKVTDMATNRSWYPQVLSRLEHESTALRTIDAVAAARVSGPPKIVKCVGIRAAAVGRVRILIPMLREYLIGFAGGQRVEIRHDHHRD